MFRCTCEFICLVACCSNSDPIIRSESVTKYQNPIRIRVRRVSIRQTIRRPTYESTRRSVSVRTMQTRHRFGPEIASFHVSVCFCVICLFTVVNEYLCFTRIISCERLIYYTSMITRIISCDVSECSLYLYSKYECLSASFHVLLGCHY